MLNYGEGNKHQHNTLLCSYKLIYISTLILQIKNKEMSLQATTMSPFTSDTREREHHLTVTVRSGSFWHSVRFSKRTSMPDAAKIRLGESLRIPTSRITASSPCCDQEGGSGYTRPALRGSGRAATLRSLSLNEDEPRT